MPARLNVGLLYWHTHAASKRDLQRHKVNASHHLGHGMLHLDAAVDLNEVRLSVWANQELQRPYVAVAGGADRLCGARQELFSDTRRERR